MRIEFSSVRRNEESVSFTTRSPLRASMFFTHVLAWIRMGMGHSLCGCQ